MNQPWSGRVDCASRGTSPSREGPSSGPSLCVCSLLGARLKWQSTQRDQSLALVRARYNSGAPRAIESSVWKASHLDDGQPQVGELSEQGGDVGLVLHRAEEHGSAGGVRRGRELGQSGDDVLGERASDDELVPHGLPLGTRCGSSFCPVLTLAPLRLVPPHACRVSAAWALELSPRPASTLVQAGSA